MPLTSWPFGITARALSAANASAGSGDVDCVDVFASGTITAGTVSATGAIIGSGSITVANGSVYGGRSNLVALGSQTVTLTSALLVTTQLVAPFTGVVELVLVNGATANITRSIRVVGGVDSTGTAITTLTVGSATSAADAVYTTIGGTVISQGSFFVITSAVTATVNTAYLTCNMIALAS